jgi:hypothetical protein
VTTPRTSPRPGAPGDGHAGWRPTSEAAVAYGGLTLAVTVLAAVGVVPRWPGVVHLVALPPLDLAADLRWLLARATGWPSFLLGTAAAVTVRVLVLAVVLGGRRPRLRLAAGLYLVAGPPLLLAAQLDFVAHAALYSRLVGAALVVLLLVAVPLLPAPWTGTDRLWTALRRGGQDGFRLPTVAAYAVVLLAVGALAELLGPATSVALVPAAAAATAVAATRLARPAPSGAWWRTGAVAGALVVAWGGLIVTRGSAPYDVSDADRDRSFLVMSGINSASGEGAIFELEPARIGSSCDRFHYFSYAGDGDGQPQGSAACPKQEGAPYVPEDTQRPFAEQVDLLADQVADLPPPVTVLAHSQAAWVAWQAAGEGRLDGVDSLVLVGPFPSSPLGFPPTDEPGPGRVGGELFRVLEPLPDLVDFDFQVDAPLTRELLATPDAAGEVFSRPLPDRVAALSVTASSDLALMPNGWRLPGAVDVCPIRTAHPYLPVTPDLHRAVDRFLDGDAGTDGCPPWPELYRVVSQPLGPPPHGR